MDVIELLQQEHRKARSAFETLLAAPPAERDALWLEIEEQCLYGPIARAGASDPALSEWVSDRHQDEVYEVEGLIEEADGLDPEDGRWLAAVR